MIYQPAPQILLLVRHLPGKHDQSTHGRGKGGVRQSLAKAKTTDEVAAAFQGEAKQITGHDIDTNFSGADVQLAREHSEGLLRGLEAHPKTQLGTVGTYGPGGNWNAPLNADAMAITEPRAGRERILPDGKRVPTAAIYFNNSKSGHVADTQAYRDELKTWRAERHVIGSKPQDVATHELGHVFAEYGGTKGFDRTAAVQVHVYGEATRTKQDPVKMTSKAISKYASYDQYELTAEMFSDVMLNGSKASQLSKDGMAILEHEHNVYVNTIGA